MDREVIQDISGLFLEFTNEGNSFSNLWDQSYERSFNMAADFHEDKKFQSSKKKKKKKKSLDEIAEPGYFESQRTYDFYKHPNIPKAVK